MKLKLMVLTMENSISLYGVTWSMCSRHACDCAHVYQLVVCCKYSCIVLYIAIGLKDKIYTCITNHLIELAKGQLVQLYIKPPNTMQHTV